MNRRRGGRDRPAIEAALSDTWRAAIGEFCAALGVPRDRWLDVPPLRSVAEVLALYARADGLRAKKGCGQERAALEAGLEMGIEPDAVSARLRDWLRAAWKGAA